MKLRQVAILFDAVAAQARTDAAYQAANDASNAIWLAIGRLEDLATVIEDMAPMFHREPDDAGNVRQYAAALTTWRVFRQ